jgi:hypothetical protein
LENCSYYWSNQWYWLGCCRDLYQKEHLFSLLDYQKEIDQAISDIGKNVNGIESDVSNLADIDKMYDIVKDQKVI